MKPVRAASVLALMMVVAVPAQGRDCDGVLDVVEERIKVSSGGTLHIDLDAGNVEVTRGKGGTLIVSAERCAGSRDQLRNHTWSTEKVGDDVEVLSRVGSSGGFSIFGRSRHDLHVVVKAVLPADYNVAFSTGAGDVIVSEVVGAVSGQTGAGNLRLTAVHGPVDVTTGSGNVNLREVLGKVRVQTGAGNVDLRSVEGELAVQTGAGNITAEIMRQPKSRTELQSGAGNVTVVLAPAVRVDVEAVASVGSANTDFPLKVEGSWMTKSFGGSINGGGPQIVMRSGVGNVNLRRR